MLWTREISEARKRQECFCLLIYILIIFTHQSRIMGRLNGPKVEMCVMRESRPFASYFSFEDIVSKAKNRLNVRTSIHTEA